MLNRRYIANIGKVLLIGLLVAVIAGCAAKSVSEKQVEEAPPESLTISGIHASQADGGMRVSIEADSELNYTAIKQRDPLGVILYLPLTKLADTGEVKIPENDIIDSVIPTMAANQKNARVEIKLLKDAPYNVEKEGTTLNIRFGAQSPGEIVTSEAEAPDVSEGSIESKKPAAEESAAMTDKAVSAAADRRVKASNDDQSGQMDSTAAKTPVIVKRIDFSAKESGKSAIIIETSGPVEYQLKKINRRILKVYLDNTRLPEYHQERPLITTRFDSAVDRIIPTRAADKENQTQILIELREAVPYHPVQANDQLTIHFEPSGIGPRPFETANLPPWQKVIEDSSAPQMAMTDDSKEMGTVETADPYAELLGENRVYTGQKIALDFFETNIKNVFRILQQVSGKNFAIDPDVKGTVTLSFQKPVPWDQVLDLVLQMNGLDKVEKGEIIRIATVNTLKAEEDARRQRIQAIQERQKQQKQLEPMITEYIPVSYANAQNEVLPHVKDVLSKDRGNITVDQRNNQLIITDTKEKIAKAKEILTKIDKVTPQVIIEARIVEANDNFSRKVGVTWAAVSEDVYRSDLGGNYSYNSVINTPFIGGTDEAGTENPSTFNFAFERLPSMGTPFLLDATLRAMETDQVLKIISTPKIVTLDNKEATITQGVEWPYQNVEDDDVETEFKEINLTLKVTPHITPDERVSLEINLIKDDIQEITASGEPALSTNEAQTELLIDNGQTIVIGGIVKRTESNAVSGLPILKDVPGIGWLFSAKQDEVVKRELLIFMTPNIVQLEQRGLAKVEVE